MAHARPESELDGDSSLEAELPSLLDAYCEVERTSLAEENAVPYPNELPLSQGWEKMRYQLSRRVTDACLAGETTALDRMAADPRYVVRELATDVIRTAAEANPEVAVKLLTENWDYFANARGLEGDDVEFEVTELSKRTRETVASLVSRGRLPRSR